MGKDKGLKLFLGRPLIERVVARVQPLSNAITLITNHPADYAFLGLQMFGDETPGLGPLGGMLTALTHCSTPRLAVVACDMPFVNVPLLAAACDALEADGCDAAVPLSKGGPEPLHAVYRVDACAPVSREMVTRRELKVGDWLGRVRTHFITYEEVARFDPDGLAFINVNIPEEFRAAEAMAKTRR
jgi:molybdopterin-guanine dinucleotide biosynthesis protein A